MEKGKETKKKTSGKVKVTPKKKELTLSQLKAKGVNILKDDYLTEEERVTYNRRIEGKPIRFWRMTVEEFLKQNKGKEIYLYPYEKDNLIWEVNGRKYIRGYSE